MEEIIELRYKKPALPHCLFCGTTDAILVENTLLFSCGRELKDNLLVFQCANLSRRWMPDDEYGSGYYYDN